MDRSESATTNGIGRRGLLTLRFGATGVGLVGFGLVASAPDGPCDDESGLDPALG